MTVQRTGAHVGFSCDDCPMTFEDDDHSSVFDEVWKSARAAGWRSYKTRDGWEHYCPDCVRKQQRS
jgi:hypothetical protein